MHGKLLFRQQELAYRTQYAELKERTLGAGHLLPGTPGYLSRKNGTGYAYWYRVHYPVPGARDFRRKQSRIGSRLLRWPRH